MKSTRRQPGPPFLWSLMAPLAVLAFSAELQTVAQDSSVPTAIEQALIEHRCRTTVAAGAPGTDAYQECPGVQLLSLRTDFGRDLSRLSAAERRSIDADCSTIRASQGRDGYVDCLSGKLVSLSNRRTRTRPDSSAAAPPPHEIVPAASLAPLAIPASSSSSGLWIGVVLIALAAAAGGVFLAMKTRRSARKCRVCGMNLSDSGDLCQKCRHEAAETVKRAAAERTGHERAQEEAQRQQSEHKETELRLKSFEEEEARLRQQEQARQEEQARREAGQLEEEARQRRQIDVASEEVFDPCSILGVSRDATQEAVRAAYQEAKLKYDPEQVAHLGAELQEHFKAKAKAVEEAYQQLTR
jgi:DnaJ-domain-containing protein 1